jgi:TonB family protein
MLDFNACNKPEYTTAARRAEAQGTAVVVYTMDVDGRITEASVEKSSGPTSAHKALDRATLEAVRACAGRPGSVDGKPVRLSGRVEYVWYITGGTPLDRGIADHQWESFKNRFISLGKVGREISLMGGRKYFGELNEGFPGGLGVLKSEDHLRIGTFSGVQLNGLGIAIEGGGRVFIGEFTGGVKNGVGTQFDESGKLLQSGRWASGVYVQPQAGALASVYVPSTASFGQFVEMLMNGSARLIEDRSVGAAGTVRLADNLIGGVRFASTSPITQQAAAVDTTNADSQKLAEARDREATPAQPPLASRSERRVALVIGNAGYKRAPLANPVNDAVDVASSLRGMGFETTLVRDATLTQMRSATRQFAEVAASSDVALIFFAGHGIEAKGRNYVIPVSAEIKHEYELEDEAFDAGRWLDMLESLKPGNRQRVNIVILDACRNNEFARSWRSTSRGLARMDAPTGTFVAFATAPGKVAADGARGQRNSPFTRSLLKAMQTPDLPIELMFKEVRRLVIEETKNEQVPWENSSLVGDFVFKRTR